MDYEEAYKEALERAKSIHHFSSDIAEIKRMEQIFPELAESEDEKIKKAIKYCIKQGFIGHGKIENVTPDECLAWLEKQGKPKWSEEDDGMVACIKAHLRQSLTSEAYTNYRLWIESLKQRMEE